jgi:hypothetical protein
MEENPLYSSQILGIPIVLRDKKDFQKVRRVPAEALNSLKGNQTQLRLFLKETRIRGGTIFSWRNKRYRDSFNFVQLKDSKVI